MSNHAAKIKSNLTIFNTATTLLVFKDCLTDALSGYLAVFFIFGVWKGVCDPQPSAKLELRLF